MKLKPHNLVVYILIAVFVSAYLIMAVKFPIAYIYATYEDLFGEWMQFYFFFLTVLFSLKILFSSSSYRYFFLVLAIACFYVMMEEISWGQRVFGWSSPGFFKEHNLQGETNLHNFLTGPYSTSIKAFLEYVLAISLMVYGVLYPFAIRFRSKFAVWLDRKGIASPPLVLWPLFIIAAILELGLFRFNEAEVAEIMIGIGMAVTALYYAFALQRRIDVHRDALWSIADSKSFAFRVIAALIIVLAVSGGTTYAMLAFPRTQAKIERRIENGMEKFARRYMRYEQWDIAVDLYERLLRKEPDNSFLMRKIADAYKKSGNDEKFRKYGKEAIAIDLERYEEEPMSASANRSLARTYRMMGNETEARKHIEQALAINLERIKEHPESSNAAYSLGKTYELMEHYHDAFEQYDRAYKLRPTSKRFRKAYYRARKRL